jgi:hypothetical protein
MGMDVMRYEVIRALAPKEALLFIQGQEYNENIRELEINDRVLAWMDKNNIGQEFITTIQDYDWKTWFEQNPQYKDYNFGNYSLGHDENQKWFEMLDPDGKTVLFNDGFIYKDRQILTLETKQIGYMRKPFRHSETPTRVEGDTVVISVTNFSDEGEKGFDELMKIDEKQTEDANVFVFDVSQLDGIKKYSCSAEDFQEAFTKDWKTNHFVQFNW